MISIDVSGSVAGLLILDLNHFSLRTSYSRTDICRPYTKAQAGPQVAGGLHGLFRITAYYVLHETEEKIDASLVQCQP